MGVVPSTSANNQFFTPATPVPNSFCRPAASPLIELVSLELKRTRTNRRSVNNSRKIPMSGPCDVYLIVCPSFPLTFHLLAISAAEKSNGTTSHFLPKFVIFYLPSFRILNAPRMTTAKTIIPIMRSGLFDPSQLTNIPVIMTPRLMITSFEVKIMVACM